MSCAVSALARLSEKAREDQAADQSDNNAGDDNAQAERLEALGRIHALDPCSRGRRTRSRLARTHGRRVAARSAPLSLRAATGGAATPVPPLDDWPGSRLCSLGLGRSLAGWSLTPSFEGAEPGFSCSGMTAGGSSAAADSVKVLRDQLS